MNLNGSSYKRKFMVILSRFNGAYDRHSAKAETKKVSCNAWLDFRRLRPNNSFCQLRPIMAHK